MIKGIDHIGIAVKSLEEAKKFWVDTLGLKYLRTEDVPEQKVRIAVLAAGTATVELLEPTAADSPVQKFLNKRGEGLHGDFVTRRHGAGLRRHPTGSGEHVDDD